MLDTFEGDRRYVIGMAGAEGFIGWPILLGDDLWPNDVVMRAESGNALRMPADVLLAATRASPTLRGVLLRFATAFMIQMSRTILSSLPHPIDRRWPVGYSCIMIGRAGTTSA